MNERSRRTSANQPGELDAFKLQINLTEFATTYGYTLDPHSSSRNSAVMVHPAGDKIIVARSEKDRHWIYFSVHDDADHGSIIDFVLRRDGGTLNDVLEDLRPWLAGTWPAGVNRPMPDTFAAHLDPIRKDLVAVRRHYEAMRPIDAQHTYLEDVRQIPLRILTDPLFSERIRVDEPGNAIFPHYNRDGLCGFERRGPNVKNFAAGAVKGLWFSQIDRDDRRLVVAESAVDALSYAALRSKPATRYVSTAGALSPDQAVLLQRAIAKLPAGGDVVLAVDHDPGGAKLGHRIEAIFAAVNRADLTLAYDRPAVPDTDWNDALRMPRLSANSGPRIPPPRPRHD